MDYDSSHLVRTLHYTTTFHDNFPGFDFWGDLILSKFQNQFCACSEEPGKKSESGILFNTNMPAALRVIDCIILPMIKIKSMLRLSRTSML